MVKLLEHDCRLAQAHGTKGGTELVYKADMSQTPAADHASSLAQLQQVIERRINPNGTGEYVVETERGILLIIVISAITTSESLWKHLRKQLRISLNEYG